MTFMESQNSETESSTAGMFLPNGVVLAETDDNSFGSQCVIFTGFWIRPLQAKFSFRIELNKFQSLFICRMIECP